MQRWMSPNRLDKPDPGPAHSWERSPARPPNLDAPHGRAHSARMVIPFDTLKATEAMESVAVSAIKYLP